MRTHRGKHKERNVLKVGMFSWQMLLVPNQDNGAAGASPTVQQVRGRKTLWTGHHHNTHTLTHSQPGPI